MGFRALASNFLKSSTVTRGIGSTHTSCMTVHTQNTIRRLRSFRSMPAHPCKHNTSIAATTFCPFVVAFTSLSESDTTALMSPLSAWLQTQRKDLTGRPLISIPQSASTAATLTTSPDCQALTCRGLWVCADENYPNNSRYFLNIT